MQKYLRRILTIVIIMSMILNSTDMSAITSQGNQPITGIAPQDSIATPVNTETNQEHAYDPFGKIKEYQNAENTDNIDENSLMLKVAYQDAPSFSPIPEELIRLGVDSIKVTLDVTTAEKMEVLGAKEPYQWLTVTLKDVKATDVGMSFQEIPYITDAEYNYTRQSTALPQDESNPYISKQWAMNTETVRKSWSYMEENGYSENLKDVVVAVIDTGIDYNHINLSGSMWVNIDEIQNNGIDDDGNGYVDDIYGVSTIGSIFDSNGNPMDEMGHGTHVAGIIAAAKDTMGIVGLAYGVKIMAIKAGSGYFNDSDIIEGINYAIQNGADVINMSFGSYARSAVMEDALALAYTSAVLVAAAGNDGTDIIQSPCYPAAYNFVIGVMATDEAGLKTSFTNTDVFRHNSFEYEVCAPGVNIFSTLPDNRYASWSGTSMAAPYVSAIAALLRAKFNDKTVYSTRYIMGQIGGTAINPDSAFPVADPYRSLTETPEPRLSFYDYYIFDDPQYSDKNNGNGIIDAGETIGFGVLIRNHWGQARKTNVKLIAAANAIDTVESPHVTWIKDSVEYGDIGTFVSASNGFSYDEDGVITGISDPFLFTVDEKTPNDAYLNFTLVITCESYPESGETRTYTFNRDTFTVMTRRGVELPRLISRDMTLKSDTYYIISGSTLIEKGVTVTVEPGTQIQFWGDYSKELYAGTDVAKLLVDGEFIAKGTTEQPIEFFPSGSMYELATIIAPRDGAGKILLSYCNIANPQITATDIDHCYFTQLDFEYMCTLNEDMNGRWYTYVDTPYVSAENITDSIFYQLGFRYSYYDYRFRISASKTLRGNLFDSCGLNFSTWYIAAYSDNVFLKNYRLTGPQINDRKYLVSEMNIGSAYQRQSQVKPLIPVKNPENGSTYFVLKTQSVLIAEEFAQSLGGHVAVINDDAEKEFLLKYASKYYGSNQDLVKEINQSGLGELYIGFYNNGSSYESALTGQENDFLKLHVNGMCIPYISVYAGSRNDVIEWTAQLSTIGVYSYQYNNLTSTDIIGDNSWNCGVIVEIPGGMVPLSIDFDMEALVVPSNTENYRMTATIFPALDGYSAIYTSDNPEVITVDAEGKITAKSVGSATVTVEVEGTDLSDTVTIVVTQYYPPTAFTDTQTEITLRAYQETKQLTPTVQPDNSTPLIVYTSSNPEIATVNMNGTVTALSSGNATVKAVIPGTSFEIEYHINVVIPPESIEFDSEYIVTAIDAIGKKQIMYSFSPSYSTLGNVKFECSDNTVVTVDKDGYLTPKAPGVAVILVSFPEIERYQKIKVFVAENNAAVNIIDIDSSRNNDYNFLYAEDGTTYLLTENSLELNQWQNRNLPLELSFKTKQVNTLDSWSYWLYIDMEDCLYLNQNQLGSQANDTLIEKNVAEFGVLNNSVYWYRLLDGTVKVSNSVTNVVMEYDSGIRQIGMYSDYILLLEENGTLRYVDCNLLFSDEERAVYKEVETQLAVCVMDNSYVYCSDGQMYYFLLDDNVMSLIEHYSSIGEKLTEALNITMDDIVDFRYFSAYGGSLFLLSDGRVAFTGNNSNDYYHNFDSLIGSRGKNTACFFDFGKKVTAISDGSFLLDDGSVLTFGGRCFNLGNGKAYGSSNCYLKYPVSPWIGYTDDGIELEITDYDVITVDGVRNYSEADSVIAERVTPDTTFVFRINKIVDTFKLKDIMFRDGLGNYVKADASLNPFGTVLTVKPAQALVAGYSYTLTVPAGTLADGFSHVNSKITVDFTVSGTAVYEIPVTGITGSRIFELQYGEAAKADAVISPDNATMTKIYYSSSDENVAIVNVNGVITAKHNGTAIITATTADGGFTTEFTVHVSTKPDKLMLASEYYLLVVGETGKNLNVTAFPSYADIGALTYTSSDQSIVSIDAQGNLTGVKAGTAIVTIYSEKYSKSCTALVNVVQNADYIKIASLGGIHNGTATFVARDGTVWFTTSNSYNDCSRYLPNRTDIKAKSIYWGVWCTGYYISPDNTLYSQYDLTNINQPQKIDDNVEAFFAYYNNLFYTKQDGSFWSYTNNTAVECANLSDITMFCSNGSMFCFVNDVGEFWYISSEDLNSTNNSQNYKRYIINERIVYCDLHRMYGESGTVYSMNGNETINTDDSLATLKGFQDVKSRIVKIVYTNSGYIALLNDGTVMYFGTSTPYCFGNNLNIEYTGFIQGQLISGIDHIVDINEGYFLKDDGTVLSFSESNGMGNNNKLSKSYQNPVVCWFGAIDDLVNPISVSQTAVNGTEEIDFIKDLNSRIPVTSDIKIVFNKIITNMYDGIILKDINGESIEFTIEINGSVLILKPMQNLAEGMIYTVTIPQNTLTDIYNNPSDSVQFTFVTEGTLHLEIPVTGISDTVNAFVLEYGQRKSCRPTVSPDNATAKNTVWQSSDSTVASVSQNGVVTAGRNGTAVITAQTIDGGFTLTYEVTVNTPAESFGLEKDFVLLDLSENSTETLASVIYPEILSGMDMMSWESADESIVTVDENGKLTAVGIGMTAVYCRCSGIDDVAVCVVSVTAEGKDSMDVERIYQGGNSSENGYVFVTSDSVWITNSYYRVPRKIAVTNVKKALAYQKSLWILDNDNTLYSIDIDSGTESVNTLSGITDFIIYSNYVTVLTEEQQVARYYTHYDGSYHMADYYGTCEIEGVVNLIMLQENYYFLMLDYNGVVWQGWIYSNEVTKYYDDQTVVEFEKGDAFMITDSGERISIRLNEGQYDEYMRSSGFATVSGIVKTVPLGNNGYYPDVLFLKQDGSLGYFGQYIHDYFFKNDSEYTVTETGNSLYSITTNRKIKDIGGRHIIFEDGSVIMFGYYGYFGNGAYTDDRSLKISPYFIESANDLNRLTGEGIWIGEKELHEDETAEVTFDGEIRLDFCTPLMLTDDMDKTILKDSGGNNLKRSLRLQGNSLIITPTEALTAGQTYTLKIFSNAVKDVFSNTNELAITVSFTVTGGSAAMSYDSSMYPSSSFSPDLSLKDLQNAMKTFYGDKLNKYIAGNSNNINNAFLNAFPNPDTTAWMNIKADTSYTMVSSMIGNYWGTVRADMIDRLITDVKDDFSYAEIIYDPYLTTAPESAYPFVVSVQVQNSEGKIVSSVGLEEITVIVTFNRDMNTDIQPFVTYGSDYPFGDFKVDGAWRDAKTWVGKSKITAVTGSGTQYFKVRNAVAASDSWLVTGNDYERFAFVITTSGAKSIALQASGGDGCVELQWMQDDFDTLAGYNIYRSTEQDGNYKKLNTSIIPGDISVYTDNTVESGVTYYYCLRVVKTDFTESEASPTSSASSTDTTPPTIQHNVVTGAPSGAAISIVAYAYDNKTVAYMKLYYRTAGTSEFSCVDMYLHTGDNTYNKYSATIPVSAVGKDGVEYYLVAGDSRQESMVGSATTPYTITTYQVYSISVLAATGGSIMLDKTVARAGDLVCIRLVPGNGYVYLVDTLSVKSGNISCEPNENLVFVMPAGDVTVTASFVRQSTFQTGDINRDGTVDSADAILVLRYDVGLVAFDAEQKSLADMDGNSRIDVYDARAILRADAGL